MIKLKVNSYNNAWLNSLTISLDSIRVCKANEVVSLTAFAQIFIDANFELLNANFTVARCVISFGITLEYSGRIIRGDVRDVPT